MDTTQNTTSTDPPTTKRAAPRRRSAIVLATLATAAAFTGTAAADVDSAEAAGRAHPDSTNVLDCDGCAGNHNEVMARTAAG